MKRQGVLLDFVSLSVDLLIEFERNIVLKMTANPYSPTPDVALAQITNSINNLILTLFAAEGEVELQTANLKAAKKALIQLLCKNAAYMDKIAYGNEAMILSSGLSSNT